MPIDEIRYANNFNAFRNGMLFFEESKAEDVYNILGIKDWKNILTNKDIREIILHPTYEGLEKLIAIKDSAMFERVRAAYSIERTIDEKANRSYAMCENSRVSIPCSFRYLQCLNE